MCIALATSRHWQDSICSPTSPTTTVETAVTNPGPADNTPPPLHQVSDAEFESKSYYFGLPSRPISVHHTPLKRPTGLEAYHVPKKARPVFGHPIVDAWDELGPPRPRSLTSIIAHPPSITHTHTMTMAHLSNRELSPQPYLSPCSPGCMMGWPAPRSQLSRPRPAARGLGTTPTKARKTGTRQCTSSCAPRRRRTQEQKPIPRRHTIVFTSEARATMKWGCSTSSGRAIRAPV